MSTDKRIVKVDNWIYYEIWTDDEPNLQQIRRQQAHYNDTEGALYPIGFPNDDRTIGRWWSVNVEAEEWKEIAGKLYLELKLIYTNSMYEVMDPDNERGDDIESVLKQCEQLCKEQQ